MVDVLRVAMTLAALPRLPALPRLVMTEPAKAPRRRRAAKTAGPKRRKRVA